MDVILPRSSVLRNISLTRCKVLKLVEPRPRHVLVHFVHTPEEQENNDGIERHRVRDAEADGGEQI